MNEEIIQKKYYDMGICPEVYNFGKKIEEQLKERFEVIDSTAEYNQMKVIDAMQKCQVSAECLNQFASGYVGGSICGMLSRRSSACASADHMWHPCPCSCVNVKSSSGG